MHSVSIVGCGYTGLRLATRWVASTDVVSGYAARPESVARIAAAGIDAHHLDLDRPLTRSIDVAGRMVYYSVPPAPTGDTDGRLQRFLEHLSGTPRRVIYLGTTGVYGDRGGARVNEDAAPDPRSARAVRRMAAETMLRTWADARAISWCILRIAGIYGPGRLPIERLRRGDPAIDPRDAGPGNRIQVEDLVSACVAAGLAAQADRRIYNVTDGTDESATGFLQRVARIVDLPGPPLISRAEAQTTLSPMALSFLNEARRVDNGRMLDELDVTLAFHDLDAGIRASL